MEFDHGTETISPDDTVTTITIGGTGGLILPSGNTAQRPTNVAGLIRWNSETASLEINDGSAWNGAGGATGMATGIVSAPGWAFTANTTTGIYQPSAGVLSFAAGGGEQFRIVNTANAVNYLTVTGNTGNSGPVLGAAGSATNIDIYFQPKGLGAVYAMNPAFGLIYGVYNDAGATANTQYLTFSNASTGNPPYVQANGTDATVDMHFRAKSATGKHVFGTTTNQTTLHLQSNASAVNYLTIQNAVAASAPSISAAGTDANISITLTPKGTGGINITSGPISVAGSAGTSGQVLTSGGPSASPTWTTVAGGGGAPTDATYLTLSTNATLTDERTLAVGSTMVLSDAGAGGAATISKRYGGETWTTVASPAAGTMWRGMAYGNGTFVMLEGGTSSTAGIYSKDGGETWTSVTLPASLMWAGCAYGNGIFVAAGALASNSVITSPDGVTWTNRSAVLPNTNTHSFVAYANGAFFIASYNTTVMSRSYNGTQWFDSVLPASTTWQAAGGGDGYLVVVASGSASAARSIDGGATFQAITLPAALDWRAVAYGDGTFVVIPSTTANNVAARSTDGGATWSSITLPSLQTWYDVVYANGMFLVVSTTGTGARSFDGGATWTSFTLPFTGSYNVMYGDGRFMIGGSGTDTAYSLAGDANNAGGNLGSLMYADNSGINAAQNVGVLGENLWIAPSNFAATPSRGLSLFGREYGPPNGGRVMLAAMGPSGMDYPLQPSLWRQSVALWRPPGNATTVPGVFGFTAPTAGGTATARTVAVTNALTRSKRLAYVSSATAGNYGGHYSTAAQWTVGTGTIGGFFYSCRFGVSDAALQTAARTFVGMTSSVAAPTNVDPATLTNAIGIGKNAADTNWFIYYGGSTAQTRIDLGVNFPVNTTDIIDITLWSPPNQAGVVFYHATRITTTNQYESSGKLGPGTAGVTIPAATTLLTHRAWRNNNTAAAAVGIDVISVYIETDW